MFNWIKSLFGYNRIPDEVLRISNRLQRLFVYEPQKVGTADKYRSHVRAYDRGLGFYGDCDDYAYTAFYAWREWCRSVDKMGLVAAAYFRVSRIRGTLTYHITLEVVATDGKCWVFDNRVPYPYRSEQERSLGYDLQYMESALVSYRKAEEIR